MEKATRRVLRPVILTTAALLCAAMAGCAPSSSAVGGSAESQGESAPVGVRHDEGGTPTSTVMSFDSESYQTAEDRWAGYDDGSDLLDIKEHQVHGNALSERLTIDLTEGAFSQNMEPADVRLTGAMASWSVASVERKLDKQLVVEVHNPEGGYAVTHGPSVAGIVLSPSAIELGEEEEDRSDEGYAVSIPCVYPFMAVDVQDTEVVNGATAYRIVASDFTFPDQLSRDDFEVVASSGSSSATGKPDIISVDVIDRFQCEVVVTGDATEAGAPHRDSALVLSDKASGTGGSVGCSLLIPDVWTSVELRQVDGLDATPLMLGMGEKPITDDPEGASVDEAVFEVRIHSSNDLASKENTRVSLVDGESLVEVTSFALNPTDDGSSLLTIDCAKVRELLGDRDPALPYAILDIDVEGVEHAASGTDDPYRAAIMLPLSYDFFSSAPFDLDLSEAALPNGHATVEPRLASFDAGTDVLHLAGAEAEVAGSVSSVFASDLFNKAKSALGAISGIPWGRALAQIAPDSALADPSNAMLYQKLNEAIGMLNTINETSIKTLENIKANYDAGIVNDAKKTIRRIQSDCTLLNDWYVKTLSKDKGPERTAVADEAMASQSGTVNDLFLSLQELHGLLEGADARTGKGLLGVYLSMAEASNNWEGQAVSSYRVLSAEVATIWKSATNMLYVICGSSSKADMYASMLNELERNTTRVNEIITASEVPDSTFKSQSWTFPSGSAGSFTDLSAGSASAYKCIYTGEWYVVVRGSDTLRGWGDPWLHSKKRGHFYTYTINGPFCTLVGGDKSPFKSTPSWDSMYLTTAQAKGMVDASHSGSESLQHQIESFAGEGALSKYLVTDPSFGKTGLQVSGSEIRNDHKFDTFGSNDGVSTFTDDMVHYEAYEKDKVFRKNERVFKSSTSLQDICALAKVQVTQ